MTITNRSTVVAFDGDAVVEAVREVAGDAVRTVVEFDADSFNPLFVDDLTASLYDDETRMLAHFERIHSYVHLDLAEIDLMTGELFPVAERVRYITTALDAFTLVRIYVDREGLFLALDSDAIVAPIVDAVLETIE